MSGLRQLQQPQSHCVRLFVPIAAALAVCLVAAFAGISLAAANQLTRIRLASRINPQACVELCSEAISEVPDGSRAHPAIYYYLAQSYLRLEKPEEAANAAAEGRAIAASLNSRLVQANLALLESVALHSLARYSEGAKVAAEGVGAAASVPNQRLVAKLETERGSNLVAQGDLKQGLIAYRRALEIADEVSADDIRLAATANLLAATEELQGAAEAVTAYRQLLDDLTTVNNPFWVATLNFNLGRLLSEAGDHDEAATILQAAIDLGERTGAPFLLGKCWLALAVTESKRGSGKDRVASCLYMAQIHAQRSGDEDILKELELLRRFHEVGESFSPEELRGWLDARLKTARENENYLQQHQLLSGLIQCESITKNWERVVELQSEREQLTRQRFNASMRAEVGRLNNVLTDRERRLEESRRAAAIQAERQRQEARIRRLVMAMVGLAGLAVFGGLISLIRRRSLLKYLELQKRIDEVLRESLVRWETTFDAIREPICVVDRRGNLTASNRAFKSRFLDDSPDAATGDFLSLVRHHFEVDVDLEELPEQMQLTGVSAGFEQWYLVHNSSLPWANGQGESIFVFRDVTSERRYQHEIQERQRSAEDESRAKSEFMAIVSHEIRTPINAINAALELLGDSSLSEPQRELLQLSSASSSQLTRMIEDLLGYASIESGKLVIQKQAFDVRAVVAETLAMFRLVIKDHPAKKALAAAKVELPKQEDVELLVRIDPQVPRFVFGDKARYRQIITNLIANACRHTERGSITTVVRRIPGDDPDSFVLETSVNDTGAGISEKARRRIFLPFEQEQSANTRTHGGVGLGLAICSKLVELMGGEIRLESEVNVGSQFRFTIPTRQAVAPKHDPDASQPEVKSFRVLLVDDEPVNLKFVSRMLGTLGQEVTCVASGAEAIQAVEADPDRFEVVFMDLMMPGMSGFDTASALREKFDELRLPIVALTGRAAEEDREASRAFGMNAFLTKPVSRDELRSVLAQLTRIASLT